MLLLPCYVDRDTVQACDALAAQARAGTAIGIAYCVMLGGREYRFDVVGECTVYPTFTRGMLRALDDKLSLMVHGLDC